MSFSYKMKITFTVDEWNNMRKTIATVS